MASRSHTLAAQLLDELKAELRTAEEAVNRLRSQIEAVEPLVSTSTPKRDLPFESVVPIKPETRTILVRAKHTADLVVMFLRKHPGAMVPEIHAMMVEEGLSVGKQEYLYTVIKKLEKKGLVRRDLNSSARGGRYYAVTAENNLAMQPKQEGRLLSN